MTDLRVAFLGAGLRGVDTARTLVRSGVGHPVGFWNRTPAAAAEAAQRFCTVGYASISDLIAEQDPDLVAIMTNPAARSELIEEAVAAGARALLIEKPLALSLAELERVEAAAGDVFVAVNMQYQWMPHWQQLIADIAAGRLGTIRSIRASVGMHVFDQGPHAISVAMAVADAAGLPAPTWVLAAADGEVDYGGLTVPADMVCEYDLGRYARFSLVAGSDVAADIEGETVQVFQQQTEVTGDRGRLQVSLNQGLSRWNAGSHRAGVTRWGEDDFASQSALFSAIADVLGDEQKKARFPTRLEAAARQSRMMFSAIESARQGRRLALP